MTLGQVVSVAAAVQYSVDGKIPDIETGALHSLTSSRPFGIFVGTMSQKMVTMSMQNSKRDGFGDPG